MEVACGKPTLRIHPGVFKEQNEDWQRIAMLGIGIRTENIYLINNWVRIFSVQDI